MAKASLPEKEMRLKMRRFRAKLRKQGARIAGDILAPGGDGGQAEDGDGGGDNDREGLFHGPAFFLGLKGMPRLGCPASPRPYTP